MALLGKAALAMWWNIDRQDRAEFEHWHTTEHFSERLAVPGFLRGTRWASLTGEPSYFVMYELQGLDVLNSAHYRERVNNPTPWSTQVMAGFRNMVRSQCRVQGSQAGGLAEIMLTLRFSPQAGQAEALRTWIVSQLLPSLAGQAGITGAHLLENMEPAVPLHAQTAEQKLRGGDAAADWVLLVSGYNLDAVNALAQGDLTEEALTRHGVAPGPVSGLYRLAYAMSASDLAAVP